MSKSFTHDGVESNGSAYVVQRASVSSKVGLLIFALCLAVLLSAPLWAERSGLRLVVEFACYLALAQMWNLLAGYAGLVSVGQQAFVGLGGYLLFILASKLGISPLIALISAGVLAGLLAIPTAFVVFRLKGAYFAIGTWVVAEVFRLGLAQATFLGGGSGQSLPVGVVKQLGPNRELLIYYVAVGLAVAAIMAIFMTLRSRQGLALTAVRDSEAAAGSLGVDTSRIKLAIYVGVAAFTGVIGALLFLQKLRISPDAAFNLQDWTAVVIFIVIIGGIGTLEGPLIGTLVYFLLRGALSGYGPIYMILLGVVAVGMMLWMPQGIWGTIQNRFGWQLFALQRKLRPAAI
ncbi:branched-chain amino acid ABC transporter permease [Pseudomonas sp. RIT-To-2]|uniref:branched-chain amino acid ABC transporter permease n=1 Tax=Pseudomonas sp. RIT-To-2 TaxID=3462541 RepID=UPI004048C344